MGIVSGLCVSLKFEVSMPILLPSVSFYSNIVNILYPLFVQ